MPSRSLKPVGSSPYQLQVVPGQSGPQRCLGALGTDRPFGSLSYSALRDILPLLVSVKILALGSSCVDELKSFWIYGGLSGIETGSIFTLQDFVGTENAATGASV